MNERLEDIEFFARSRNRVAVLEALVDRPHTRRSLQLETGASRVTISRIVADLQERGWIRWTDGGYRTTPTGRAVASALIELCETLDVAALLAPLAPSLPPEFLTIDVKHFRDAEVGVPTKTDPLAAARTAAELMDQCDEVRILAHAVTSDTVASQIRAAEKHGQRSAVVLSEATLESMRGDPTMHTQLDRLLDLEEVAMYRYDGTIPVSMGIYDDETVGIGTIDQSAYPNAFLVSTDETVLEWARETFDEIRRGSEVIRSADLRL
ncbi:helix-turn-helix transcriptional regulator [Natronosalvus rutilus]|uniref:Uncharacterized protein n=1 Tax=Natronosalvus rutilus TaxID=2953753 RepID=A0A9E7SVU4_9EURY|nr:hypothetical protein [Natronosalvus rutilus]UTF54820.1 hypothetical protein NGM29_06025 [Natronosalvus rutilus]